MSSAEIAQIFGYKPSPIDPDRGVSMRQNVDRRVYMYKSMPGMYLNQGGGFVSDEIATEAGFDVDRDRRKAKVEGEIKAFNRDARLRQAEVEAEMRAGLDPEVRSALPAFSVPTPSHAPPAGQPPFDIITERNPDGEPRGTADFTLRHKGGGRWNILQRDDETMIDGNLVINDALQTMVKAQMALDDSRSAE